MAALLAGRVSRDVHDEILARLTGDGSNFEDVARRLDVTVGALADDRVIGFACWVGDSPVALLSEELIGADRDEEFAHQLAHLLFAFGDPPARRSVHRFVEELLNQPAPSTFG